MVTAKALSRIFLRAETLQEIHDAISNFTALGWTPYGSPYYTTSFDFQGWEAVMERAIALDTPDTHDDAPHPAVIAYADRLFWAGHVVFWLVAAAALLWLTTGYTP